MIKVTTRIKNVNLFISKIEVFHSGINKSVFMSHQDEEIYEKNINYLYQPSSSLESSIPFPYCPLFDQINDINHNDDLNDSHLIFDFSFVGRSGPSQRKKILNKSLDILDNHKNIFDFQKKYFYDYPDSKVISYDARLTYNIEILKNIYSHIDDLFTETCKKINSNNNNNYYKSINNTKICLAPVGFGLQTRRFYEILKNGKIPFLFVERKTKLPLHWIINWEKLIPIIYTDEIYHDKFKTLANTWILKEDVEIKYIGNKCKEIFDKYLNVFYDNNILINFILLNEEYINTLNKRIIFFKSI